MILFFNVILTDDSPKSPFPNSNLEKINYNYDRGNLLKYNQVDIFKYSLSSLSVAYDWSKVIIKVELGDKYKQEKNELENYIKNEFKNFNLIIDWKRNEYQKDWINTYDILDDDLIWFCCNHDHIFIDNSKDYLKLIVDDLYKNEKYPYVALGFSHFPECIRMAKMGMHLPPHDPTSYKIENRFISVDSTIHDSIMIITKQIYYDWWCKYDLKGGYFPRPESHYGITIGWIEPMPILKFIIPLKELCRHFDGYNHSKITNNQCPAIDIPFGFFNYNMKIRYGYSDYKDGWININPMNENYYAHDKSGTDYKFTLQDIPLFWRNRISEIDSNLNISEEKMIQYRLKSILEMIYTSQEFEIDQEVENKILNYYLQSFPNYEL